MSNKKQQSLKLSLVILKFFLENPGEVVTPLRLTNILREAHNKNYSHSVVWYNLQLLVDQDFLYREAENFKLKNTIQKSCYDAWAKARAQFLN